MISAYYYIKREFVTYLKYLIHDLGYLQDFYWLIHIVTNPIAPECYICSHPWITYNIPYKNYRNLKFKIATIRAPVRDDK